MTIARIYRPDKTAMQSGRAKTGQWRLELAADSALYVEPLMGWSGGRDTTRQLVLFFPSEEAAVTYAKANNLVYEIATPQARKTKPKSYADNFKYNAAAE